MKKFFYIFLFFLLLFGSFLVGSWYSRREAARINLSSAKSAAANVDKKIVTDTDTDTNVGTVTDTDSLPSGTVKIPLEKQQAIGVRLGLVEKKPVTHTLRILGRVAPDETRTYRIIAFSDGWILETFNNPTGAQVNKDDVLATFYAPELISTQRSYIFWLSGLYPSKPSRTEPPDQTGQATKLQYIENLQKLGMGNLQIEEIARTRQFVQNILIRAPASGFIFARNVSPGQKFDKGTELFRIVDLSHVWVLADIFENESAYFQPGKRVKISLPNQERTLHAKISNDLPQFDPLTRTLKVRLEADNPGFILRPDMFVDVEFPVNLLPVIMVPTDAVLDSGIKKTVFVDLGNGLFEPREVETGRHLGNRVEIKRGLKAGEKIAMSGNFLIDSESRLEMAAAGMVGILSKDPVCGADVSVNRAEKAGWKSSYQGKTYYFTSDECKQKFDKNPEHYVKK